nr:unnamed protein product [Leishmania braziliensis]
MASCKNSFFTTIPSSPVDPTAHLCDDTAATPTVVIPGAVGITADTRKMSSPHPSAKTSGGPTQAGLSQSYPHSQHQQLCAGGLLDPFFLMEIDENIQVSNNTAATSGSRTSLSGDGATISAKDAALWSPRMGHVLSTHGKTMRESLSAGELYRECGLRTSMCGASEKDEADDSKQRRRQPSSWPSSSRRDTAECLSRVEVVVPAAEVTAAENTSSTIAAAATAGEAELKSPGRKRRSVLTAWVTSWTSTSRKAGAPPIGSGLASRGVSDFLAPLQTFSFSHSPPSCDHFDTPQGNYTPDCETTPLLPERADTAVSANSSSINLYAHEAQGRSTKATENSADTGGSTVGSAVKSFISLIRRRPSSSTASPHTATPAGDDAANVERHPTGVPPYFIEEVSYGVEQDVLCAHDDDMRVVNDSAVTLMGSTDWGRDTVAEEPALRASAANRCAQRTGWSVGLLPLTAWLCGSSAVGASLSTAFWRAAVWPRPVPLAPCPCVSAQAEQHAAQEASTVLASEAAMPGSSVSHQRHPSPFTAPALYTSPPSLLACMPVPVSTKVSAMYCWAEHNRVSLSSPAPCSVSTSEHLCAVPPSLTTGSTPLYASSILGLVPASLADHTSLESAGVGHITSAPSCPTTAAEGVASRQSCDVWRLARCYAHFERAVEQRGDDGVWSVRGTSCLSAWESVKLVVDASVARADTESRLCDGSDNGGAWPLATFDLDGASDTPGASTPTSPQLTSAFPFFSVSAVLRAEKDEEVFARAAMWALEQMSGEC